jgi:hypothetical protein
MTVKSHRDVKKLFKKIVYLNMTSFPENTSMRMVQDLNKYKNTETKKSFQLNEFSCHLNYVGNLHKHAGRTKPFLPST